MTVKTVTYADFLNAFDKGVAERGADYRPEKLEFNGYADGDQPHDLVGHVLAEVHRPLFDQIAATSDIEKFHGADLDDPKHYALNSALVGDLFHLTGQADPARNPLDGMRVQASLPLVHALTAAVYAEDVNELGWGAVAQEFRDRLTPALAHVGDSPALIIITER